MDQAINGAQKYVDNKNNLKIEYSRPSGSFGNWIITDAKGCKYYFSTYELAMDYYSTDRIGELNQETGLTLFVRRRRRENAVTSWYLDSVVSAVNDTIRLQYTPGRI